MAENNPTSGSATPNLGPDATPGTSGNAVEPTLQRGAAAKAVGGGLEAGSTDFGSSTTSMSGGRGGVGSGSSRMSQAGATSGGALTETSSQSDAGPGPAEGMVAAGGHGVLNTGRRTDPSDRGASGAAAASGSSGPATSQVSPTHQRVTDAASRRARTADMTEDQVSAPNLIGASDGLDPGNQDETPQDLGQQLAKATKDARDAQNKH